MSLETKFKNQLSIRQCKLCKEFLTVWTIKSVVYNNDAMRDEVYYLAKVVGIVTEAEK